jgi:predicted nucleic acid-binding protein
MARYFDTPMDFADSTLLLLADDLRAYEILTLDRRGFSTYRTPRGKVLRLVLSARA